MEPGAGDAVPIYSVIVPAYNAAAAIGGCVQALLNQSVPRHTYEILVVDDGSTDATAEVAARYPIRVLHQAHAGPACARNYGARETRGRYLLFTDADCEPIREWIEHITRPFEQDEHVAGVKGTYRTCQRSLIARVTQVELEEKYDRLRRQSSIDFVDTGSAAFRREAFWEAGGFDTGFREASNEDTLLSFTLVAQGWRLVFAEQAAVYHRHTESLARYLLRKWRHGYWRVRVYRQYPTKIVGDSYTPRSLQLQFAGASLAVGMALVPGLRRLTLGGLVIFGIGTIPFIRRALPVGRDVAVATPPILFLRSLALAGGLAVGTVASLRARWGRDPGHRERGAND